MTREPDAEPFREPVTTNYPKDAGFLSNVKPERYSDYHDRRNWFLPITFLIVATIGVAGYGAYYFYNTADMFNSNKALYAKLGIELPRSFEAVGQASRYLGQLSREPCDNVAMTALAQLMETAGYPRESAKSLETYNQGCTVDENMLQSAYAAYTRIGDHKSAVRVADELTKLDTASYNYRFMRGTAHERSKDYKAALADYISTLELFPDLSNVSGSQFYQVSLMYDKLGKPCAAIGPLETFISYNVKERHSQQIAKLISDYSKRGNCAATYANGSARVILPPTNVVDVTINGTRARMIIDTGASTVSITQEMAARVRITPDDTDLVDVKTVGGRMKQAAGYAQTIQVADATAASVPILIAINSKDAFGAGIDGLLGMTFLSRFNATISPGLFELKPRTRN